ncbi:MAG: hypothetical protein AAFR81_19545 [Chloroflexota bacterium]
MFKTQYEHPPRKWYFWALYIGMLASIFLPLGILVLYAPVFMALSWGPPLAGVVVVVMMVVFLLRIHPHMINALVLYFDLPTNSTENITDNAPPAPPEIDAVQAILLDAGFTLLEVTRGYIGLANEPTIRWLFTDETQAIVAHVWMNKGQALTSFQTVGDAGVIMTNHGYAMIRRDDERAKITSLNTTVADALGYHAQQVAQRYVQMTPAVIDSPDGRRRLWYQYILPVMRDYYRTYLVYLTGVHTLWSGSIALATVGLAVLVQQFYASFGIDWSLMFYVFVILGVYFGVRRWYFAKFAYLREARKKKKKKRAYPDDGRHPLELEDGE